MDFINSFPLELNAETIGKKEVIIFHNIIDLQDLACMENLNDFYKQVQYLICLVCFEPRPELVKGQSMCANFCQKASPTPPVPQTRRSLHYSRT